MIRLTPAAHAAAPKFLRGLTVLFGEIGAALHGVNEVVGRMHAAHHLVQTGGNQHVAGDNFSVARDARAQKFRVPSQTSHAPPCASSSVSRRPPM